VHDAGIPVALGTDAGNPLTLHGASVFMELEAMQASGLAPRDVLVAATGNAARALGLDSTGTVAAGAAADLVVLDADPLSDIRNVRQIALIVRRGEVYTRTSWNTRAAFPTPNHEVPFVCASSPVRSPPAVSVSCSSPSLRPRPATSAASRPSPLRPAGVGGQIPRDPSPDSLREYMRRLSARPHHVGSPYDKDNAEWLLAKFQTFGLDAHIETFDVLFPTPKERVVELVAPTTFRAKLQEPPMPGDPTSSQQAEQLPTYNAYSIDGDVTAPLVYVNFGVPADYERLARMGCR